MLASAPPRFLLPLTLIVVLCVAAAVSLHKTPSHRQHGQVQVSRWPLASNPELWEALDHLLERLPLSPDNTLRLNSQTTAALERVAGTVQQPLTPLERQRIRQLASQSLPGKAGEQTFHLLTRYLAYHQALAELAAPPDLAARKALQTHYFGPDAPSLFHQENAMRASMQQAWLREAN